MLGAPREAAPHPVPQGALLLRLASPGIALDQVPPDALAAFGAVAVPKQLLGLKYRTLCVICFIEAKNLEV